MGGNPREEDRGAAGVDEATAFLSHWGPPPLRPTEESEAAPPDPAQWSRPAPPSRTGAGGTADNPAPPARPRPDWSRAGEPPAPLPPVAAASGRAAEPELPSAPTEPAAERWIAERLAAGRRAASAEPAEDRFAGYWATEPPHGDEHPGPAGDRSAGPAGRSRDQDVEDGVADRRAGRPDQTGDERSGSQRFGGRQTGGQPGDERAYGQAASGRERAGDERAAGQGADGRQRAGADRVARGPKPTGEDRVGGGPERAGEERFAGYWARDRGDGETGGRDEPTEVLGPFDVGAWSRDAVGAPARPRARQRQAERPEPVTEQPDDRAPAKSEAGGRGGEPPKGGGSPPRRRRTFGDRIRTFLRGIGQLFITLGLVLLLLAVYEVWFTDVVNHRTQKQLATSLQNQWNDGDDPTVGTDPTKPGEKVRSIPLGEGFALIYIPDFGTDYVFTVVEGTGTDQLNKGPGHYADTALPGEIGNVAIAGHRVGKGSPFLNLDKLKAGSAIVIRTKSYWYTYRVVGGPGSNADAVSVLGFPGREIVDPSDVGVIAPVPDKPGAKPSQRLLTLTTCHPKFTARQRMVIHAALDGPPFPVSQGIPPSMTGA